MSLTKDFVTSCLTGVPDPIRGKDLVSSGALLWVSACDTYASVRLNAGPQAAAPVLQQIAQLAHSKVAQIAQRNGQQLDSFIVEFVDDAGGVVHTAKFGGMLSAGESPKPSPPPGSAGHEPIPGLNKSAKPAGAGPLPGVRNIIAVGAGKGGVGKSSIALNLAVGLARRGHAVGLLDADIYGPSMPTMLGLAPMEQAVLAGRLQPFYVHGIKAITIGKLVDDGRPLIWRGPMAHGAFKQLAEQTAWGELDYLIIDLPPGTGDIALTMAQSLTLSGAVVVCTPQKVAQDDAVRAAGMFKQLGIPILGVVENMSAFIGDDGKSYEIFGKGGAEVMAQKLGVPFLGAVPITMSLRENSDKGDPTANFEGQQAAGVRLREALESLAANLESQAALAAMRTGAARPVLTIT
ncbi:MAG: Mrp/NBP35 family ATP-binding protein [Phycisphaerales bacterium]